MSTEQQTIKSTLEALTATIYRDTEFQALVEWSRTTGRAKDRRAVLEYVNTLPDERVLCEPWSCGKRYVVTVADYKWNHRHA